VAKETSDIQINLFGLNAECIRILLALYNEFGTTFPEVGMVGYGPHDAHNSLHQFAEDTLNFGLQRDLGVFVRAAEIVRKVVLKK
jgi:hypothetical protein